MRERPILMSSPMVRALLAGTKTQTRRIAKFVALDAGFNLGFSGVEAGHYCRGKPSSAHVLYSRRGDGVWEQRTKPIHCPYGAPGDRLYIKEKWAPHGDEERHFDSKTPWSAGVYYAADGQFRADHDFSNRLEAFGDPHINRWRSPLFMPRWASRVTLELTDVRIQRLQAISEEDAIAEGVDPNAPIPARINGEPGQVHCFGPDAARKSFALLWDGINGRRAPWQTDPWCWAITFRRVTP